MLAVRRGRLLKLLTIHFVKSPSSYECELSFFFHMASLAFMICLDVNTCDIV